MATTYDDELMALAADNQEPGVSFSNPTNGKRIFGSMEQVESAAFAKAPPAKLQATVPQNKEPVGAPPTSQIPLLQNIEAQLKAATESQDTMEAARILGSVRGEIAKESAKFYKETQGIAHAEFGVPMLEQTLQQAIKMDDLSPGYRQKYGMADSDETAAIRRQAMTAKQAADSSIQERLAGNGTYQELMAKAKVTESIAAHRVQLDLDGDSRKQAEADEFYYSRPPEQRKLMDEAFGNDKGDPRVALANLKMMSGDAKKQFAEVIEGGERVLPKLAIAGNVFARRIAVAREAKIFGSPDIASKKLEEVELVANDNRRALEEFTKLKAAGVFGPEGEKLAQTVTLLLGPAAGTSAADQEKQRLQRIDIASRFARYNAEKEFDSDIMALRTKSQFPPPAWLAAEAASGKIGKIDEAAAIALAYKAPTLEERQARIKDLTTYVNSAVDHQNKSLLFQVSPLKAEKLKASIGLFPFIGQNVEQIQGIQKSLLMGGADEAIKQGALRIGQSAKTFLFGE